MDGRFVIVLLVAAITAIAALLGAALALAAASALSLPTHTPGARYYKVRQGTIGSTICVNGWTKTIRPPASYTNTLKRVQLAQWHYADQNPSHYEEDHLISLELGGAPYSKRNLWPEPRALARKSDPKENAWHHRPCDAATAAANGARRPRPISRGHPRAAIRGLGILDNPEWKRHPRWEFRWPGCTPAGSMPGCR
jgi:hypothetical protein